jgi:two-component system, chemotaxis family, protein-glutamate methylesterase/glutaminase
MSSDVRRLVAIGGSWGGITALRAILHDLELPPDTAAVVVLHRQPVRSELTRVLGRGVDLPVEEAEDKDPLVPGTVHVAPPDYHLLVERGWLSLSTDEPIRYSRPSIDVLFESAAGSFPGQVVGVVLTGASDDGTDGARAVRQHGGRVIVQDPATAEQAIMPRSVVDAGAADHVVPLDEVATTITAVLRDELGEETYA